MSPNSPIAACSPTPSRLDYRPPVEETPDGAGLRVSIAGKTFRRGGAAVRVLGDIDFRVAEGKVVCLYGPSGCGKSTLLRIIAGLDTDYDGQIRLDGSRVAGPTREIGLTVQAIVSYDWLTVAENMTFGLRYAGSRGRVGWLRRLFGKVDPALIKEESERLAAIVGLSAADLRKYPEEISGGMKQRMAFARALLTRPRVLLLDEPFSSLDFESRQSLQEVVLSVRRQLGISFVCVTHDPEEALYLADEVLVMGHAPATLRHRYAPALPQHGNPESRYTHSFQQAKRELREWINYERKPHRMKSA